MLEGQWGLEDRSEGDDFKNLKIERTSEIPRFGAARGCQPNAGRKLATDADAGF